VPACPSFPIPAAAHPAAAAALTADGQFLVVDLDAQRIAASALCRGLPLFCALAGLRRIVRPSAQTAVG
jgi:hypothetical protein